MKIARMAWRLEYEYEIEYEYDFSHLVLVLMLITFHTNLIPRLVSSREEWGLWNVTGLKFESRIRTRSHTPSLRSLLNIRDVTWSNFQRN